MTADPTASSTRPRDALHARPAFHRILVGHDGTPASRRAMEWASHYARLDHAAVTVVCVAPPPEMPQNGMWAYGWWPQLLEEYSSIQRALHEVAESAVDLLRLEGIDADAVVPTGSAPREIARVAQTHHADLVVVGAHGRRGLARFFLGSTSDALLGRVDASILVARTPPPAGKVLVAVDGSASSYRATAFALRYAERNNSELIVHHVLHSADEAGAVAPEGYFKSVVGNLDLSSHPRVRYVLEAGDPADRILALALDEPAGLIVTGARGLGAVEGRIFGSVSHKVTDHAAASALVVREAPR